jgi:hypothetical protein
MTLDTFLATTILDTSVVSNTIVRFVVTFVALLMALPVMWRKGRLWNFSVLQRVHHSRLVYYRVFSSPFANITVHMAETCNAASHFAREIRRTSKLPVM